MRVRIVAAILFASVTLSHAVAQQYDTLGNTARGAAKGAIIGAIAGDAGKGAAAGAIGGTLFGGMRRRGMLRRRR